MTSTEFCSLQLKSYTDYEMVNLSKDIINEKDRAM